MYSTQHDKLRYYKKTEICVVFPQNTIMHKNYADSTNKISTDGNIVKQLSYDIVLPNILAVLQE